MHLVCPLFKIFKPALFKVDDYDLGISNSNFNFHSWLNADGSDLLHNLRRAVQVNESLMDPHLETIPGLGAFTTRCLPGSDSQSLGGHAHRSFHLQVFLLSTSDQVSTDLLK